MSEKLETKIEEKINKIIQDLGFTIEYIEFVKEGNENILRVVIDGVDEKLVNIDDCENVSRSIEDEIDKLISKEYVLEVSSPGLERQLKNIKLYKKYVGHEIFVKLFNKTEYGKEFMCILESVDEKDNTISVKLEENEIHISVSDIASAHTTYDFSKVLKSSDKTNINELNRF